jgi:hypothetical protein
MNRFTEFAGLVISLAFQVAGIRNHAEKRRIFKP